MAGARPDDRPAGVAKGVIVADERCDRHHALDEHIVEFDEEAVLRAGEHHGRKVVADLVFHEAHLLPLDQLALSVGGAALGLRAFDGDVVELL